MIGTNLRSPKIQTLKHDSMKLLRSVILCITAWSLCIYSVCADEWEVSPSFIVGQEYRDNFNLTETPLEVWRTAFAGGIDSEYRTERGGIIFNGEYRGSRYIDNTDLNQDEGLVNFLFDYSSELDLWELDAGINLTQPSSSQLEAGNQVFNIITIRRWHITPSWNREINDYNDLKLDYSYEDTTYDDIPTFTTRFSDYYKHIASAILTHHFSEYTDLLGIGTYTGITNDSLRFNSDQYSLQAATTHEVSDSLNFYFAAGAVWLVSKPGSNLIRSATRNTNTNFIFDLKVEKEFEYTSLTAEYERYLQTTVSGGYVIRNQISAYLKQKISDQLTGTIKLRAFQSDRIKNTLSQNGRQNFSTRIELTWEFLEKWFLNGGYQYAWQDFDNTSTAGPGEQNTVFLSVRYELSPYFIAP